MQTGDRFRSLDLLPGVLSVTSLLILLLATGCASLEVREFEVVVYGGTAGGEMAAIAAGQDGASVALLEPGRHIGGMVSGGLGRTDLGNKTVIGGMSREFFVRLGKYYGKPIAWNFEPHVAENAFNEWLKDAKVRVFLGHRLERVAKRGNRIISIRTENGVIFASKIFIDCSYEGDLMARAGISYTWGREGEEVYGESLAGVREYSKYHQFDVPVSAYDENGARLPCVYGGDRGRPGQGDNKIQAYNFRVCLCNRKDNRVPFPLPPNYNPHRYEILRRYLAKRGQDLKLNQIMIVSMMPNGKTDINNRGPFSTDHIGANWDYPEADYARRREIWDDHVNYVQGLFYFLANDPSVPRHLQDGINQFGLAKDEFADTGHWPHQMYVREARRMIGEYVLIQKDLQTEGSKPDSIGMGSYNIDSHHVQRVIKPDGTLENEGDMQIGVQPYEIPYRSLTPKRHECANLMVPVCISASHVAYSSVRMEPQYMIMGHSAGVAASHAVKQNVSVQDVDISRLQKRLRDTGQILCMEDALPPYVALNSLDGIVVDNCTAVTTGSWKTSTSIGSFVGTDYIHDDNADKGTKIARFVPILPADGEYEVRIAYTTSPNRATNVSIRINTADGIKHLTLNQRKKLTSPPFTSLGTFRFVAGKSGYVEIATINTNGYVVADAVQWLAKKH
ncbi:MAG: FAD-dependent oxidoreductase [Planctomycetota bacterium]|nr:MAG: FAD-dependent oxidoreductase [Planctomycetota bacterium]